MSGLRVCRVASGVALRRAIRRFRSGVIAVASPPAADDDLVAVGGARRRRPALRALLANLPADADQRLRALELGFDDAVPLALGPGELARRIARLGRHARRGASSVVPIGLDIELDLVARALRRGGRRVHLRPLEYRLLVELARHPGRPVSRAALLQRVWGSEVHVGSRTVDVHIRWLREKLEPDPGRPIHLLTVRGVGYLLEVGVGARPAARLRVVNAPTTAR
jgi:DNA-binding response OmpR family regulator